MLKNISKYYWWCQVGGWLAWMLFNVILSKYYGRPLNGTFFIDQGSLVLLGIGLTHILRWFILKFNFLEFPLSKLLIRIPIMLIIWTVFLNLIRGLELMYLYSNHHHHHHHLFSLWRFIPTALLLMVWVALYFMGYYFQKEQQYQIDKLQLEATVKELELRTIKSHLNPHFLFNALNSIRALVDEDPQHARTAITELSNILRASIKTEKMDTVSLGRELKIVKDYLAVEHIRFENRLQVKYDIDEETLDLQLPPLMLQTLVENAIKHGISRTVSNGIVEISSKKSKDFHEFIVRNSGHYEEKPGNDGFGLKSIRESLKLLYKNKASFSIYNVGKEIVEAVVKIPLTEYKKG